MDKLVLASTNANIAKSKSIIPLEASWRKKVIKGEVSNSTLLFTTLLIFFLNKITSFLFNINIINLFTKNLPI